MRIEYEIPCFNRLLNIEVENGYKRKTMQILKERYNFWINDEGRTLGDTCLEEYILEGLSEANINYVEIENTNMNKNQDEY